MRSTKQFRNCFLRLSQRAVLGLELLGLGAALAQASSISYNFTGALNNGYQVTGSFTFDMSVSSAISDFSFTESDGVNSQTLFSATGGDVGDWALDTNGQYAFAFFNPNTEVGLSLDFATLPGSLDLQSWQVNPINATLYSGYLSDVQTFTYSNYFLNGSVATTTPEPPSLALCLGGLLLAGLAWRRHSRVTPASMRA